MLVWIQRAACLTSAFVLVGCAATAPKEQIRLSDLPKLNAEIVRMVDARLASAQTGETVQMASGQGVRIPSSQISPDPIQVIKVFVNEYLEEKSVKPLTASFAVTKLDVAILKGKGSTVTPPPGAEDVFGFAGAALAKGIFQTYEDIKAPNFIEAVAVLKSDARELICAGRSSIDKDQTADATLLALRNAAYQCGLHLLP